MKTFFESLEDRRLLSVSTSGWTVFTKGASWTEQVLLGTTISETATYKVRGSGTFSGKKGTELEGTVKDAEGTTSSTSYFSTDKAGDTISLGSATSTTVSGQLDTTVTTESPYAIVFPATLTAKKSQTYSWTATTTTTVGTVRSVSSESLSYTFRLRSAKEREITVPAGKFKTYLLQETVAVKVNGHTTTKNYDEYVSPTDGIVEVVSGSGAETLTVELTKIAL
jgi:hypothetical protein